MKELIAEIVSEHDWKHKWRHVINDKLKNSAYRKAVKAINNRIFKKRGQREVFLKPDGKRFDIKLGYNDNKIISFINEATKYKIPDNKKRSLYIVGYALGVKQKEKKKKKEAAKKPGESGYTAPTKKAKSSSLTPIIDILKEVKNRADSMPKRIEKFNKVEDEYNKHPENTILKRQYEGMKKSIDLYEDYEDIGEFLEYYENRQDEFKKARQNKDVIVITYDPRKVASISTEVSWRSCMNLYSGEYRQYMPGTVESGTIVAYLAKQGDEHNLQAPKGRILFKPYFGNKGDVMWSSSDAYPRHQSFPESFKKTAEKFINQHKPTDDYYLFDLRVYQDTSDKNYIVTNEGFRGEASRAWDHYADAFEHPMEEEPDEERVMEAVAAWIQYIHDNGMHDRFQERSEFISEVFWFEYDGDQKRQIRKMEILAEEIESDYSNFYDFVLEWDESYDKFQQFVDEVKDYEKYAKAAETDDPQTSRLFPKGDYPLPDDKLQKFMDNHNYDFREALKIYNAYKKIFNSELLEDFKDMFEHAADEANNNYHDHVDGFLRDNYMDFQDEWHEFL